MTKRKTPSQKKSIGKQLKKIAPNPPKSNNKISASSDHLLNNPSVEDIERSTAHIIVEIVEYVPNAVVIKTIIKKSTGNISVMSFDSGEGLMERSSPFDTFIQVIDGRAEIVIDGRSNLLDTGQGIIIPAHESNFVKPNGRFKMILTIIKSGYE